MAEPTCPRCAAQGTGYIVSKDSREKSRTGQAWYVIVHCDACGHVYGVFPKHVFAETRLPKIVVPRTS